jgi:hypothetical protein
MNQPSSAAVPPLGHAAIPFLEALESRTLYSSDPEVALLPQSDAGARSGSAVATCGNLVAVGAYLADVNGVKCAGSVRIYDGTTGALLRTVVKQAPAANEHFGDALATSADGILVVGARGVGGNSGAVFLVNMLDGEVSPAIMNPTPANNDVFGASVAVAGKNILVGAQGDDTVAANAGAAYLFARDGTLLATYLSPDAGTNQYFGCSVANLGDDPVVGAYYSNRTAMRSGAVFQYDATLTGTFARPRTSSTIPRRRPTITLGYASPRSARSSSWPRMATTRPG